MNPETIHDALCYLDDDLIEQTDELRRGRRLRPAAGKIIPWLVSAACLALVLGVGTGKLPVWQMNNSAPVYFDGLSDMANGSPGESAQEENAYGSGTTHESPESWERVVHRNISLSIPAGWGYELTAPGDGSYGIAFCPASEEGMIRVACQPGFGVCGTGLTEKKTTVAGMAANAGFYDGSGIWSFITFPGTDYVIISDGAQDWMGANAEVVARILDTIQFG